MLRIISILLCLLLLLPPSAFAYTITESELTRLEQIFDQLSNDNQRLQANSNQSAWDWQEVKNQLTESKAELIQLRLQLTMAQNSTAIALNESKAAQALLQKERQYVKKLEKENKRLKLERNLLLIPTGALIYKIVF